MCVCVLELQLISQNMTPLPTKLSPSEKINTSSKKHKQTLIRGHTREILPIHYSVALECFSYCLSSFQNIQSYCSREQGIFNGYLAHTVWNQNLTMGAL